MTEGNESKLYKIVTIPGAGRGLQVKPEFLTEFSTEFVAVSI